MPDAAREGTSTHRPGTAWFAVSVVAASGGAIAAMVYAITWFTYTAGHCGVVRFYEHLFGIVILGGWLAGLAVGMGLAAYGFLKRSKAVVPGAVVAVLANLGMVLVCAKTVHAIREADFSLKSTERLLRFLAGEEMDDRQYAAHELGERRAAEAVPALCAILDDGQEYINLRHNASIALGKICAPPPPPEAGVARAVKSLVRALESEDEFLASTAAEALGHIGDHRAARPLGRLLDDASRPMCAREDAARALGKVGGKDARAALEKARDSCDDADLAETIDRALNGVKKQENGGS